MIEIESTTINQPIIISTNLGASHSYNVPNLVKRFQLERCRHDKSWLVQLHTRTKRKTNEIVNGFPLDMHGVYTTTDLNILHIGLNDVLNGMY